MPVKRSNISWADYSGADLNFVIGCDAVSEGCAHCYARGIVQDRGGRDFAKVCTYPEKLDRLLRAKFDPGDTPFRRGPGSRPILFPVDMGDLFHPAVPDDFIKRAFEIMGERSDVDWAVLTKRPERMARIANHMWLFGDRPAWPSHIWLGVTVENQKRAIERIPPLLNTPARVKFLSVEPMLSLVHLAIPIPCPIDGMLGTIQPLSGDWWPALGDFEQENRLRAQLDHINWVICGAESGPKRRPFAAGWARLLRDQCIDAQVPFFFKQNSGLRPGTDPYLEGVQWHQFPGDQV